jgi:hypothetical protein
MQERIEDDYNDIFIMNEEDTQEFVGPSKKHVLYIEQLLEKYPEAD